MRKREYLLYKPPVPKTQNGVIAISFFQLLFAVFVLSMALPGTPQHMDSMQDLTDFQPFQDMHDDWNVDTEMVCHIVLRRAQSL